MDGLSDVLRVIRLSGGVFLEAEFTEPWCVSGRVSTNDCKPFLEAPRHVIASHFVAAGRMQLRPDEGEAIEVNEGEIVLLPHNSPHTFGSDLTPTPVPVRDVVQASTDGRLARIAHGGGGDTTCVKGIAAWRKSERRSVMSRKRRLIGRSSASSVSRREAGAGNRDRTVFEALTGMPGGSLSPGGVRSIPGLLWLSSAHQSHRGSARSPVARLARKDTGTTGAASGAKTGCR